MRSLFGFVQQVFSSLRFRLLVLIVATCAPLIVLMLHTAGEDRRRAMNNLVQRSKHALQLARRQEDNAIAGARQLLLAISESSSVRDLDARRCKPWLDELLTTYPRYARLGVLTTNGQLLASSASRASSENFAARSFFRQVMENREFSVGDVRVDYADHSATVDFGYPVLDSSGRPAAVVFAELNLSRVGPGPELQAQLNRGTVWMELDRNGAILARYPNPEGWVGRQFPDRSLLARVFSEPEGIVETADAEGGTRFYAYGSLRSQLASAELATLLGVPRQNLFVEADRVLRRNLTWLGATAGFALVVGWLGSMLLVLRPVRTLVKASARLAAGDLTVRTGLPPGRDELGQLTLAFDQMAQALEQREQERERSSRKLQALSHRLVEVQESERRQIARELHDEIGQSLTAAGMNLQAALRSPRASSLERRLQQSIEAVDRVLEQVHDLSLSLRPSMLDDLGLEPALRWYAQRQAELTGMRADFRAVPLEERLDPVIETECFRVAQEALTNVVRHAHARAVSIELTRRNGHLHLCVRDDGVGFDVESLRGKAVLGASLGLLSMEERTSLAGGGFELRSAPGTGTEVHAWFPLKAQPAPAWDIIDENAQ